jgi:hypothetical protein
MSSVHVQTPDIFFWSPTFLSLVKLCRHGTSSPGRTTNCKWIGMGIGTIGQQSSPYSCGDVEYRASCMSVSILSLPSLSSLHTIALQLNKLLFETSPCLSCLDRRRGSSS